MRRNCRIRPISETIATVSSNALLLFQRLDFLGLLSLLSSTSLLLTSLALALLSFSALSFLLFFSDLVRSTSSSFLSPTLELVSRARSSASLFSKNLLSADSTGAAGAAASVVLDFLRLAAAVTISSKLSLDTGAMSIALAAFLAGFSGGGTSFGFFSLGGGLVFLAGGVSVFLGGGGTSLGLSARLIGR